ncbi:tetratricopeptide repeat protein [Bacteroidota bacterium]
MTRIHQKIAVFLIFLVFTGSLSGQDAPTDSLILKMEQTVEPVQKIDLLVQIIELYGATDTKRAMQYANLALREAENAAYGKGKAEVLYNIGQINEDENLYDIAIGIYNSSLELFKGLDNEEGIARLYFSLANVYKKKAAYKLSLENSLEALKLYEKLQDNNGLADVYNCLGSIYKYQLDYSQALDYYDQSLALALQENDKSAIALAYNNIGVVYVAEENNELALDYYNRSLKIQKEINSQKNVAITLGNIGNILLIQEKFDEAFEYFTESLKIHSEIGYTRGVAIQYESIGNYYRIMGNHELAIENLIRAYNLFEEMGRMEYVKDISEVLSELYFKTSQFKQAYKFQQKHHSVSDSIFSIEKARKIAQLEFDYRYEQEQEQLIIEKQKRTYRNSAIFGTLVFIIVIVYLLFNRQKSKTVQQLLEWKNLELEKKQVETDLDVKNKELATYALYLAKKNQLINVIVDRLDCAKENLNEENIPEIENIIQNLKASLDNDVWEEFEIRFLNVFEGFYDNIQERYPDLTMNEKRLAAFLRLDMSTKEIASITKQSPHSINIARTRFRKKLDLSNKDMKLSTFLSQF